MTASTPPLPPVAPAPPATLEARIRARIEDEALRTPSTRVSDTRLAVVCAIGALGASAALLIPARPDFELVSRPQLLGSTFGLAAGAVGSIVLTARRGRFGLGPSAAAVTAVWVLALPLYLVLAVLHPLKFASSATHAVSYDARVGCAANCMLASLVVGGLVLLALTLLLRRSTVVAASARGAAVGFASGLAGAFVLHLHCPIADRDHLLLGHALPIALLGWVGALLVARALDA